MSIMPLLLLAFPSLGTALAMSAAAFRITTRPGASVEKGRPTLTRLPNEQGMRLAVRTHRFRPESMVL